MLDRRVLIVEFLDLMLAEITDAHLAALRHRAGHRLELAGQQPRQRRLARPTLAHDAHGLARPHHKARVIHGLHIAHGAFQQSSMDREPDFKVL